MKKTFYRKFAQNEDLNAQSGALKKSWFLNFVHVNPLKVIYYETVN